MIKIRVSVEPYHCFRINFNYHVEKRSIRQLCFCVYKHFNQRKGLATLNERTKIIKGSKGTKNWQLEFDLVLVLLCTFRTGQKLINI